VRRRKLGRPRNLVHELEFMAACARKSRREFPAHGGVITARLNAFPILVSNLPPTQIHFDVEVTGVVSALIWVLAMGTEYPQRNKQAALVNRHFGLTNGTEDWAGEHTEDVQSLLEGDARCEDFWFSYRTSSAENVPDPR